MMTSLWHVSHFRNDAANAGVAAHASAKANEAQQVTTDLEERLDKLTLICMSMWELLRDNTKFTEADLLAKVQELDLRDGVADGKVTQTVSKCPKCSRTMSPRHKRCLYCGYEQLMNNAFDGV